VVLAMMDDGGGSSVKSSALGRLLEPDGPDAHDGECA